MTSPEQVTKDSAGLERLDALLKEHDVNLVGKRVLVLKSCSNEIDNWFRKKSAEVWPIREDWYAPEASHHLQEHQLVFMPADGFLSATGCNQFDYIFTFHDHAALPVSESRRRVLAFGGKAFCINYDLTEMAVTESKDPGFIISSYPRCGTHMLVTALSQNPALEVYGEVFVPDSDNGKHGFDNVQQVLEAFWRSPQHGFAAHAYIGYEGPSQFKPSKKYRHLWQNVPQNTPMISLRRRDLLARYVSHLQAKQSQVWNKFDGEKPERPKITVDPIKLYRDAKSARQLWKKVDQYYPDCLVVYYEDVCEQPEIEFTRMQKYLGVEPVDMAPTSVKLGGPIEESITNYDSLMSFIRAAGTKRIRGHE